MPRSETPKKQHFDYEQIKKFGAIYLSVEDMAIELGAPEERIQRLMNSPKTKFYKSYHQGRTKATISIRNMLYGLAVGLPTANGNPNLLVRFNDMLEKSKDRASQETKQVDAEKAMENVSDVSKAEFLTAVTGVQVSANKTIDDSDTDE